MPADRHAHSIAAQFAATDAEFERIERVARIGHWWWFPGDNSSWWSPGLYVILDANPQRQPPDASFFENRIMPEDRERVHAVFRSARSNRSAHACRFRLAADPNRIIAVRGDVELSPDGKPHAYFAVFQDVTDLIRAERERDQALDMYRLVAEQASDVITLRGPDGKFQMVSPALREVMGLEPKDFTAEKLLEIVHEDDRARIADYLPYEPKPGEVARITCRIHHPAGRLAWIETSKRSVFDPEGGLKGVVAVTRDVTEGKKAELEIRAAQERAEAANRAKSRFLANMSHELRTPLNAIIGFADIMRQQMFGYLGSERYAEYSMLIYDSGQLLLDLISDVLDMAKIDAGKLELNYESIDAGVMLDTCVRFLLDRADKAGLEVRVTLPPRRVAFEADRRSVKQILLNLLSNAIKFTLPGGGVTASATQEGDFIVFVVGDDGIGIPATELPRLGRPFEQVVADPLLAQSGTGLGLALVRSLAERHGGSFKMESEEGKGTRVEVRLPLSRPQSVAA
jgi:cell cycle sensor histidine kinase DivJ